MKNTLLLLLALFMMASCYKKDILANSPSLISSGAGSGTATGSGSSNSNTGSGSSGGSGSNSSGSGSSNSGSGSSGGSGSSNTSHYCGYRTKKGTPCKRIVSGTSGYCWQHR